VLTIRDIATIATILCLSFSLSSLAQTKDEQTRIVFHVTAVRSEEAHDWCTSGECSATRFTVEGYSDVKGSSTATEYVLECVEVMTYVPPAHNTTVCQRVHAHYDYDAILYATAINFADTTEHAPINPVVVLYEIKSEKEVRRRKR
jgi:hypothetical protein